MHRPTSPRRAGGTPTPDQRWVPRTHDDKDKMIAIELGAPVSLTFALRYLNSFTKATPLCDQVIVRLSPNLPVVVQYAVTEVGYVSYFLAPKIEDDDAM